MQKFNRSTTKTDKITNFKHVQAKSMAYKGIINKDYRGAIIINGNDDGDDDGKKK